MPETSSLLVFMAAGLTLLLIPGPAVLYIVTRSIDQGRLAGIASVMGISVGTLFHVAAAAIGVSALLMTSALAFNIVKLLGAGYLIYLGVRKLLTKEPQQTALQVERKTLSQLFFQGVVVNLLNPKTALFFFAFLPQFVNPARGSVTTQILFLGLLFTVMGMCSDSMYALVAGTMGNWLRGNRAWLRAQRYFAGSMYILLGVTAAVSGSSKSQ